MAQQIQFKINNVGGFYTMPRESAKQLALCIYDNAQTKDSALKRAINQRLKGATIQDFLEERGNKK